MDATTADAAVDTIAQQDLPSAFATAICDHGCSPLSLPGTSTGFQGILLPTLESHAGAGCHAWVEALLAPLVLNSSTAAVAAGRETYDGHAAAECIRIWSSSCADPFASVSATPRVCDEVFVPVVASGGACTSNSDCVSGTCNLVNDLCGSHGTCAQAGHTVSLGEVCENHDICDSGASTVGRCTDYFTPGADGGVAPDGGTQTRSCMGFDVATFDAGINAPCGFSTSNDVVSIRYCDHGLYCDGATSTCLTRLSLGASCDVNAQDCALGTICAGSPGTCVALPFPTTVDAVCQTNLGCDPTIGLICVPTSSGAMVGRCAMVGDGSEGSVCAATGSGVLVGSHCNTGSVCVNNHCTPLQSNGMSCAQPAECRSGYCDFAHQSGPICADLPSICADAGM